MLLKGRSTDQIVAQHSLTKVLIDANVISVDRYFCVSFAYVLEKLKPFSVQMEEMILSARSYVSAA
jgi:hypothetical protein